MDQKWRKRERKRLIKEVTEMKTKKGEERERARDQQQKSIGRRCTNIVLT